MTAHRASVEQRTFGPILALDGVTVSLTRDEDDGQIFVFISTDDAPLPGPDHAPDETPVMQINLNDATIYNRETTA
jgi:hypothetical protein